MSFSGDFKRKPMPSEVMDFIDEHSIRPNPHKEGIRADTLEKLPQYKDMLSNRCQGEMMEMMVQSMGAKKCIEVGVFTGFSALCVALGLPEDGKLIALDINEESASIGRKHWEAAGVSHKIDLRIGPAIDALNQLIAEGQVGTFDFAYIDADKTGYMAYYEAILQLLRPNGVIHIDNIILKGTVVQPDDQAPDAFAMRNLIMHIKQDTRVKTVILPFADGIQQVVKL